MTAPAFTLEDAQREEEVARDSPESVVVLTHYFVFTAHIPSFLNSRENDPFEFRVVMDRNIANEFHGFILS